MTIIKHWRRLFFVSPALLLISLCAGLWAISNLTAAPISAFKKNLSSKPIVRSAAYVPQTVAAYVVRLDPDNKESTPTVILVGQLVADVVMPGESEAAKVKALGYMYVTENNLHEFPTAEEIAKKDRMECHAIDTLDMPKALRQLRKVYADAHGVPVAELNLVNRSEP